MAGLRKMRILWPLVFLLGPVEADPVEVHIVCHTHDDVGWLKTVDEYYSGQNNSIQHAYVHMILDTVVQSLAMNRNRTFTYVEQAFFVRWWRQQDAATRALVKTLVKEGRLEFTNGGWCMHDEAAPHYIDMIDQTTLGHKFLMDEFGVAPRTGWQLDPFGHSATQAALLSAEVGFQGLFFGRIDYQDLQLRQQDRAAEFIWRASPSLGPAAQVFSGLTGSYHGNYGPPDGFQFDVNNLDETIQDDPNLEDYNVKSRVDGFVAAALAQANMTRGKNIMMTMGSDFQYEDALTWFYNLDRLIQHVNEDGRIKVFYSTPSRYVEAKQKETMVKWPLKEDDFFPYADGPHKFWTGYFTSRPTLKRYIRDTSAFFQVAKQITALAESGTQGLEHLAEALGVAQHHDAVSGTAKQHVTFDYAKRLARGRSLAYPEVSKALKTHMGKASVQDFTLCELRNVSLCALTQAVGRSTNRTCFALWNGLARPREELIELPVSSKNLEVVQAETNEAVPIQLVRSLPSVTNYGSDAGGAKDTLLAEVKLPPLGFSGFCLQQVEGKTAPESQLMKDAELIENENLAIHFAGGMMSKITDKVNNMSIRAEQNWFWYNASVGNAESSQVSGAYIFRPNRSQVVTSVGSWVHQRLRLAKKASHVEITYTVGQECPGLRFADPPGEIPADDGLGKEIVSRFSTDLQTAGTCFSDSNGREMLQRKRDFRPSWDFNQTEEVAGNYYPIATSLFIRSQQSQLTVLTDTSQAGTGCVRDGEIEMMVHRRLFKDDGRGVGEPLNETQFVTSYVEDPKGQHYGPGLVTRGQHWLHLGRPSNTAKSWRPLMDRLYMAPVPFFTAGEVAFRKSWTNWLPKNLEVISLASWGPKTLLLRIAHQFGVGEDPELSKPAKLNFEFLFPGHSITSIEERGLGGTISKDEVEHRRIQWPLEDEAAPGAPLGRMRSARSTVGVVTFGPLQIRTFLLQFGEAVFI
ncbi:unnamed protein product [Durusdinium trenchii]|uniref:Alpha-mannosidase n=1 Tax=Durusdinium trenchii TaxID=1381693 RepID=A0ABP0Q8I4_9DINO